MFTGIVETLGKVHNLKREQGNLHITIASNIAKEVKIDQSISHNGACLTVINKTKNSYTVTAVKETLQKTNINDLKIGDQINLERSLRLGDRLDGHLVQGHVDTVAICKKIKQEQGSWIFTFSYKPDKKNVLIEKGSCCINGVSLTIINPTKNTFSVAIIPYTYNHTNFSSFKVGDRVNIEYDILGKYIAKLMQSKNK